MSDEGLFLLYKLHQIDSTLHQLKSRAAALDTGQREAAMYKKIQAESKPVRERAKELADKMNELDNRRSQSKEKAANFETKLYSGTIISPREVEDLQEEVKMLHGLVEKLEGEISALKPEAVAAQSEADTSRKQMAKLKKTVEEKQEKAKVDHATMQAEYKRIQETRAAAEAKIAAGTLREYNAARKKTGNTGLALITDSQDCDSCGIDIPVKTLEMVRLGKVLHCESCGRILFKMMPVSE